VAALTGAWAQRRPRALTLTRPNYRL